MILEQLRQDQTDRLERVRKRIEFFRRAVGVVMVAVAVVLFWKAISSGGVGPVGPLLLVTAALLVVFAIYAEYRARRGAPFSKPIHAFIIGTQVGAVLVALSLLVMG